MSQAATIAIGGALVTVDDAPDALVEPTACDRIGHSWQRNSQELGNGEISTKDRHFLCGRHGCGAQMIAEWDAKLERWMQRIVPGVQA